MEQHSNTESRLHKYLIDFKISEIDYTKGNIFNQLMVIESYFQEVTEDQHKYYTLLKNAKKINVNKVSTETNISRSSIYNNSNILLYYINKRIEQINNSDITMLYSIDKQNDKITLLEQINDELKQQVIDSYELKLYIKELENEIRDQYNRRQKDFKEIKMLKEQVVELKVKIKSFNKDKIIKLRNEL